LEFAVEPHEKGRSFGDHKDQSEADLR